ncbi:MAG TPA: SIMPL domain-containing protein [Pyrinomonadaceae bacterium]|nr:SIMPL domain-containing protein [Pyrinomonadaceae bacterium]
MLRIFKVFALALLLAPLAAAQESERGKSLTVEGNLARTVEAGGWLVNTGSTKYLILNAQRFRGEAWFREGTAVVAEGETKPDVMTSHQEGVPFEARTMRPRSQDAAGGGGGSRSTTRVTVMGEALVESRPDTAVIQLAVVTQNASATEAQAQNASLTEAVVRAVRAAAGAGAEVETSGYSLQPQYAYKEGAPPTITSYVARNAVTVTTGELNRVGPVIDAAGRAGANSVDSLSFTLRRDEQPRDRALADATREALRKARVMAEALGGRVARIVEAQESGTVRPPIPIPMQREMRMADMSAAQTPVEIGTLEVRSQVQLVAEIEMR